MITYRKAEQTDAPLLIELYNAAFYADFLRYGSCPGYGKSRESMEQSIREIPKYIICFDGKPVGAISAENRGNGEYDLGCLCVIPEYQGKGIGTAAFHHLLDICADWKKFTLITPADKKENIKFYTEKCGFSLGETHKDGSVTLVDFCRMNAGEDGLGKAEQQQATKNV